MIVDASAIVALVLREVEAERCQAALTAATNISMAAPMVVETLMVLARHVPESKTALDRTMKLFEISIIPFTEEHAGVAHEAFLRFGKGRHPAKLNFGDCMAYAVAKSLGEPLLFVGNDFSQTDIIPA